MGVEPVRMQAVPSKVVTYLTVLDKNRTHAPTLPYDMCSRVGGRTIEPAHAMSISAIPSVSAGSYGMRCIQAPTNQWRTDPKGPKERYTEEKVAGRSAASGSSMYDGGEWSLSSRRCVEDASQKY